MGTNSLGTARGRIIIDTGSIPGSLGRAEGAVLGFSKATLGLAAGLGAGFGLAAAITDTIGASATFEQRLSSLKAVANATEADMGRLTDQALALGKSTVFSASEVADAQTELVKAGASVDDVLGGALDSVLALAAAGEIELAPAAKVVANAMNAFGLEAKDATRVADILASTANTTATDVGELEQAFAQGASAAQASGLPIEDFTAALGALAEGSVVGSDAGTSLKAALLSLVAPVGAGAKEIKKYGLEFFDANGKIKGVVGIAEELRAKLSKLNPQQRTAALQAIAGRDGFRALLAVYKLGPKVLEDNIRASQRQGQAAEVAATKQDNLRGDVEKLGGAIETLQIRAGGGVQGALRELTQGATQLVDAAAESEQLAAFAGDLVELGSGAASAVGSLAPLASAVLQVVSVQQQLVGASASVVGGFLASEAGAITLQAALVGAAGAYGTYKVAALGAAAADRAVSIGAAVSTFTAIVRGADQAVPALRAVAVAQGATVAASTKSAFVAARSARTYQEAFLGQSSAASKAALVSTASARTFERTFVASGAVVGKTAADNTGKLARLGAAFPTIAAGATALASPVGIAALSVAGLAAGVAILSSGAFSGASAAEHLANQVRNVDNAARGAALGVESLRGAVDGIKAANLNAAASALAVERAQRTYNDAVAQFGPRSLEAREAASALEQAQYRANVATREQAVANQNAGRAAVRSAVGLAELTTEIRRGSTNQEALTRHVLAFTKGLGAPQAQGRELARELAAIGDAGGDVGQKMDALRSFLRRAASELDTSTKSGRETKKVLDQLGTLDNAGIAAFGQAYNEALAKGLKPAQALKEALAEVKPPKNVKLDVEDRATKKARDFGDALAALKPKTVRVDADTATASEALASIQSQLSSIPTSKQVTVTIVPVHKEGSWTVQETLEELDRIGRGKTVDVTFKPHGTGDVERTLVGMREGLGRQLAQIDAAEEARQERNERRRLTAARDAAARELAGAKTADDRRSAQRSLNDAKAALAEFRIVAGVEARRAAIEVKTGFLDGLESARSGLSGAMSDLGDIIGGALQRGLEGKLGAIDDTLAATLDGIDSVLKSQLDSIDATLTAGLSSLDAEIDAIESARSARDTGRQRGTLTGAASDADAVVARRTEALARARTDSERRAAQKLLDDALREQQSAAEALSDFEEDQRVASLQRQRADLQARAELDRTAAQTAAEAQRTAAQQKAEADRAAAQAEYELQVAQTQRLLGDLQERLARGEITAKQFRNLLAKGLSDPKITAALEASGLELGLSFSRGLTRARQDVETAVRGLAAIPPRYLKLNSPAEKGPLAYDFTRSGRTLAEDMAAGMVRGLPAIDSASRALAGAAALRSSIVALAVQGGAASGAGGGDTYNITVPAERPVEDPRGVAARLGWEISFGGGR